MSALVVTVALALAAAPARTAPVERIDARDVRSAAVFELNVGLSPHEAGFCTSILDGQPWCAKAGRRYELNAKERERMLALLDSALSGQGLLGAPAASSKGTRGAKGVKACAQPRHAFLVQTTKGPRSFDVSFECNSINGRAMSKGIARELATFLRGFGLVAHLPYFVD